MIAVATPGVDGVTMRRHILDREAAGLAKLAQRLGRRLRVWFQQTEAESPTDKPVLPDEDTRESFDLYRKCVTDLLKEQRERAKLVQGEGAPPMDDAAFELAINEVASRRLLEMPRAELDALLKQRRIDIAANVASTSDTPAREEAIGGDPDDPENTGHQAPTVGARVSEANPAQQDGNGDFLDFGGDDE